MGYLLVLVPCKDEIKNKIEMITKGNFEVLYATKDDDNIRELIEKSEVIIGEPKLETLNSAKCLKWLQMTWAGVDQYAKYKERFPNNVILTNSSGAYGDLIAEHIVGGLLMHYLRLDDYLNKQAKHEWCRLERPDSLENKTVLILGMGNIGKETAKRLKPFKTKIIGMRRTSKKLEEYFDDVILVNELDMILDKVDIIIGCLPGTKETNELLNKERINELHKGVVFCNVGRGNLITENDLKYGLDTGIIDKAILDVLYEEPLSSNDDLWDRNVYITPHVSGVTMGHKETEERVWEIVFENLERYLENQDLKHIVNLSDGY